MYGIEEFDKQKTKVLKYIIYKKRTEKEIRNKFSNSIQEDLLEDMKEDLKENKYIDDSSYIKRAVDEYINLNTLSIKEIKSFPISIYVLFNDINLIIKKVIPFNNINLLMYSN